MGKRASVKYQNPVVQLFQNMILTELGDVWAYYKLKPFQINVANLREKRGYQEAFVDVLDRLQKYDDVDFKLLPANMDLTGRIQGTSPDWAKDISDVPKYYLGQEEVDLLEAEFKPATLDEFYVGVKLKNTAVGDDFKAKASFAGDLVLRRVAETLRFNVKFTADFFHRFETMNDDVLNILNPLGASKLSEEQLCNVLAFPYHHQGEQSLSQMRETVFDLSTTRYIQRDNGDEQDYLINLVLNLPDRLNYLELMPIIQSFKFPLEVHIKVNYPKRTGLQGMKQKAEMSQGKYKTELIDAQHTGDSASKQSSINFDLASDLVDVLDDKKYAFLKWSLVLVVRDTDLKRLKNKVRRVETRLKTAHRDITVIRPMFRQEMLLYQNMPGVGLGIYDRWCQYTQADGLAELMFGTTTKLGTQTGFYIGRSLDLRRYENVDQAVASSKNLVLLNPVIANKGIKGANTDSPHIAITGETGQGKSFLVKDILLNMAMFEVKLLYVDPKQEVRRWFNRALDKVDNPYFQELLNSFHYVTLNANSSANAGVLDPILTLNNQSSIDDIPDVATLVKEMLVQVRPVLHSVPLDTALTGAIKKVCEQRLSGEKVGTLQVIDLLLGSGLQEAQDLGRYYQEVIPSSMLRVAFSDGSSDSIQFRDQRTVLEVTGLDLPRVEQQLNTYTETQKYSVSIMLALGKYLEKFGRENPDKFSCEVIDEAWIFNTSEAGKKVLDAIKRLGRSENNMLIYATQRVDDIVNADSKGQYGQLFAFNDPSDEDNILKHFNLPVNDGNKKMLRDMRKGQCLFRDIYGRTGKIVVHSLFEEWVTAFETVKENAGAKLEEKYS